MAVRLQPVLLVCLLLPHCSPICFGGPAGWQQLHLRLLLLLVSVLVAVLPPSQVVVEGQQVGQTGRLRPLHHQGHQQVRGPGPVC